jgi:ketosteroid isomerase-like protein
MSATEVFNDFVAAVNQHDVAALAALLTDDHIFRDSLGNRVSGAKSMEAGWRGYFAMCPDYWIRVDMLMEGQGTVLAVGQAGGTINGVSWRTPAAWKAVIREKKIALWQVYADNKPVYEILEKTRNTMREAGAVGSG